jgi:hypothetical protein
MMPHAAPMLCCCCENESIRKLPRTPDTLISEEVKAPIPNAVAAGHACSAIFVRTSVAGTNVLVYSVYQHYVRKQIPSNSVSLRCLSIPTSASSAACYNRIVGCSVPKSGALLVGLLGPHSI